MKRVVLFIIMFGCLLIAVADYYGDMRKSYNKYLSGEYFFREKAHTVETVSDEDLLYEAAFTNKDYSDPKEILFHSSGASVYACDPHDRSCTVFYGDNVISDFPLYAIKIDNEDTGYFYGTKKYTFKEYTDLLKDLSEDQLESPMVSDKKMAGFKHNTRSILILVCVDAGILFILFLLHRHELDDAFDKVLLTGALYGIFVNVIITFIA